MLVEKESKKALCEQIVGFIRKEAGVRRGIDGGKNPLIAVSSDVYDIIKSQLGALMTEGIEVRLVKHVEQGVVMAIPAGRINDWEEMWRKLDATEDTKAT